MSWFTNLFHDIEGFFNNPKAKAAEAQIASLLPVGLEIVHEINALAPNRTLTEINAIAEKYAIPSVNSLHDGQTIGNVLLNLGTSILQKNHAPQAATSLLNTVIQLAVVAAGASK